MNTITSINGLFIGDKVICNTVGHYSSGAIGIIERFCSYNNPEDLKLGLCEGFAYLDTGVTVNLYQCEREGNIMLTLSQAELKVCRTAIRCYMNEASILEENGEYPLINTLLIKLISKIQ